MNYKHNTYVWNEDAMTNTHKNELQRHEHSIYPKFHHSWYGNCETQTYPTHKVSNRPDENRTQALKRNNKRTTTYTRKEKKKKKPQGWKYSPEYEKARRQKQGW
jgi:hypothetical protein